MGLSFFCPTMIPPFSGVALRVEKLVRKACYEFALLKEQKKIAVALSGGKDSLTLLYMLAALRNRGFVNYQIEAIHVTGTFSCGASLEQSFLKNICSELAIPLSIQKTEQKVESLECYSCSRIRRKIIFEIAKEKGIHTIAFGHHQDDHAQTLLMNLLHKAEFAGLLPKLYMTDYDVTIIRPLIYVTEKDLIYLSDKYQYRRITCQCPIGQNSMRKKTDATIETLSSLFPHARQNLAKAGMLYGSKKAIKKPTPNT